MVGVFVWSALVAACLTVLVGIVLYLAGLALNRLLDRAERLPVERGFAEAVAASDFDRAEQQARRLLRSSPEPPHRPPAAPAKGQEDDSCLLLPPLSNPPFSNGRCVHGRADGCRRCPSPGHRRDVA